MGKTSRVELFDTPSAPLASLLGTLRMVTKVTKSSARSVLTRLQLLPGHLSSRSDVYSFGVVLLEVISGLQSMDKSRPAGQHNLVQWAQPFFADKRRLYKLLDPRLEGRYSIRAAQTAADIAAKCLNFNPRQRPSMDEVVSMLTPLAEMSVQELNAVQASEKTPSGSSPEATLPKQ